MLDNRPHTGYYIYMIKTEESTNMMIVTAGMEIYYTGDMANVGGFGVITEVRTDRFGTQYHIDMTEDGDDRDMWISSITLHETYSGNGSTRFVPKKAYIEYRRNAIVKLMESNGMSADEIAEEMKDFEVVS